MSNEEQEETEEFEEKAIKGKKKKSIEEIEKEKMGEFGKKLIDAKEKMNLCIYLSEITKTKHILTKLVDPPCLNCGQPSIWDIKIVNKEGFNLRPIENLCQKEFNFGLKFCTNPEVPFQLAPCNCYNARQKCPFFDKIKKETHMLEMNEIIKKRENNCKELSKLNWIKLSNEELNKKCNICGQNATLKTEYLLKENNKTKIIYACKRHSQIQFSCKSFYVPFILAPCVLLENPKDCKNFEE